ncbi:MAG: divalent-cation tolerance protein CutA [Verrucomicrobiota bacterium]
MMESRGLVQLGLSTAPTLEIARQLASQLLKDKLVACISIIPGVESHYIWKGNQELENEVLLLIKLKKELVDKFKERFRLLHPYDCPELLFFDAENGLEAYLKWINEGSNLP